MVRIDYYKFSVYDPYILGGECHRTLREAKKAYLHHLKRGHHVGSDILGLTIKDDSIFLTYTPWYSDVRSFGRTELTNIAMP